MKIFKAFHPGSFTEADVSSVESFMQEPFMTIKSHFPYNFVWDTPQDGVECDVGYVAIQKSTADVTIFVETTIDEILNEYPNSLIIPIYISKDNKTFGTGSKEYLVSVNVRDRFSVVIKADSEEDAIRQSDMVPVYEWHHENIEPNKPTRKIVTFAKWWNFDVKEM